MNSYKRTIILNILLQLQAKREKIKKPTKNFHMFSLYVDFTKCSNYYLIHLFNYIHNNVIIPVCIIQIIHEITESRKANHISSTADVD